MSKKNDPVQLAEKRRVLTDRKIKKTQMGDNLGVAYPWYPGKRNVHVFMPESNSVTV